MSRSGVRIPSPAPSFVQLAALRGAREQYAFCRHRAFIARVGKEVVFERGCRVMIGLRGDLRVHSERQSRVRMPKAVLRGADVPRVSRTLTATRKGFANADVGLIRDDIRERDLIRSCSRMHSGCRTVASRVTRRLPKLVDPGSNADVSRSFVVCLAAPHNAKVEPRLAPTRGSTTQRPCTRRTRSARDRPYAPIACHRNSARLRRVGSRRGFGAS